MPRLRSNSGRCLWQWQVRNIDKIKCENCGQTLMYADYAKAEIKCPRCKTINKIQMEQRREQTGRTRE
ncbi:MAG: zinc finger domain-containing protein [Acutalibacteraceae bacterium]